MSEGDRYYVSALTGYGARSVKEATGFSVLDSAYCHREVYTAYAIEFSGSTEQSRRRDCKREAERLNALDAAWISGEAAA